MVERINFGLSFAYDKLSTRRQSIQKNITKIPRTIITKNIPLVSHSSLPSWAQDNEHILNNHRLPQPSFKYCFLTMIRWHSETGNIWTHLIGIFFYFKDDLK